jgi:phosphomannomutase/phosphoglucomutase
MLDRNSDKTMADLRRSLPHTYGSPSMSPHCADEEKYQVVDKVVARFEEMQKNGDKVGGQAIRELITVNGVRVVAHDGTWGLVRASSNEPKLVVVVESPVSEERKIEMFNAVDAVLRENPQVGEYNQKL